MDLLTVATPKRASNGRTGKRNLPTETVSILRTWYEEHQDWPYPNDSEQEVSVIACIARKIL